MAWDSTEARCCCERGTEETTEGLAQVYVGHGTGGVARPLIKDPGTSCAPMLASLPQAHCIRRTAIHMSENGESSPVGCP